MSPEEKDVILNLRAIIISCKGGLPLCDVDKDYLEVFGTNVPLRELGYNTLRHFFEKNPTDFRLSGDKVEAVEKQSSGHIASLVNRQKDRHRGGKTSKNSNHRPARDEAKRSENAQNEKKRKDGAFRFKNRNGEKPHRRPVKQEAKSTNPSPVQNVQSEKKRKDVPPRFRSRNSEKQISSEAKEGHAKPHRYEEITLRKPHDILKQCKHNVGASEHGAFQSADDLKVLTKTIANDRFSDDSQREDFSGPFKDIEDHPFGKGAQLRLLQQKCKMAQGFKSPDEGHKSSSNSPQASEGFFELDSTSPSVTPLSSPSDSVLSVNPAPLIPFPQQKAQARLANIHMQAKTNLIQNECLNNNNTIVENNNNNNVDSGKRGVEKQDRDGSAFYGRSKSESSDSTDGKALRRGSSKDDGYASVEDSINYANRRKVEDGGESARKLEKLCAAKGLASPSYKLLAREPKNEPKQYICKIRIGDHLKYSSYPLETQDPDLAREIAARKAYNGLASDETLRDGCGASRKDLVPRVLEIVSSSSYGIWSDKLPLLYKERYKEDISKDWLSIITKIPLFEADNVDGNRFIIRKKTEPIGDSAEISLSSTECDEDADKVHKMKELVVPESEYWEIYITNISNSAEIWCRLIGDDYSDAYDSMMTKLELEPLTRKVSHPKIGEIYGVKVSAIWYRVKLMEVLGDGQGSVFYIDVGDKDAVDLSELYHPEDAYFSVAPQAIMISLFELESFYDDEDLTSVINTNLLGNTYIAEVMTAELKIRKSDRRHTVTLWDTSTELDINVNQLLLNNIIKCIAVPSLPSNFQIKEVTMSSVSDNGDIHVQTCKKSVDHLKRIILNKMKSQEGKSPMSHANETIGTDILYLARCKENGLYCRAKVIYIIDSALVDVMFIDYGHVERMSVSDLVSLEKSSVLQAIPSQAIRVKLANVASFNDKTAAKLREIVWDRNVLLKVVSSSRGHVPSVEMFKRSKTGSILYLVNAKLTNDPELKNSDGHSRRKSVVVGLEKVVPKDLSAPDIPSIGEHFEVFVTLASSPDLFIVQPLSTRVKLIEMMNDLQIICGSPGSSHLRPEEFVIGALYAVKHPDGNWYRGCAQAVIGSCTYSVYMCDFGDCIMVTIEKLMHLPGKFKSFPYQAVRASLFGIPPEHRDWTPIDVVNFHKLVVEKYFVSTIMEIARDAKNPNYVSLGLVLTDTSSDEDVYIHKILLENKNESCSFIKSLSND